MPILNSPQWVTEQPSKSSQLMGGIAGMIGNIVQQESAQKKATEQALISDIRGQIDRAGNPEEQAVFYERIMKERPDIAQLWQKYKIAPPMRRDLTWGERAKRASEQGQAMPLEAQNKVFEEQGPLNTSVGRGVVTSQYLTPGAATAVQTTDMLDDFAPGASRKSAAVAGGLEESFHQDRVGDQVDRQQTQTERYQGAMVSLQQSQLRLQATTHAYSNMWKLAEQMGGERSKLGMMVNATGEQIGIAETMLKEATDALQKNADDREALALRAQADGMLKRAQGQLQVLYNQIGQSADPFTQAQSWMGPIAGSFGAKMPDFSAGSGGVGGGFEQAVALGMQRGLTREQAEAKALERIALRNGSSGQGESFAPGADMFAQPSFENFDFSRTAPAVSPSEDIFRKTIFPQLARPGKLQ